MKEKINYGNWVPEKMLYLMFGLAAVFLVISIAAQAVLHKPVIAIVAGVICILSLIYAVYMLICYETFAFGKGSMMAGVHEHLVDHLEWNGEGTLLDIGCGAEWSYAKDKRDGNPVWKKIDSRKNICKKIAYRAFSDNFDNFKESNSVRYFLWIYKK